MALVDYTSSDSEAESEPAAEGVRATRTTAAAAKRRKTSHDSNEGGARANGANGKASSVRSLPPLPPAFHDLYASTVRVSTSDDPALHQGRKRVNSHKVGNWPSHIYIEWHPNPSQRAHLTTLLSDLQTAIDSSWPPSSSPVKLTSFLTSDLSAPQPLHISLSRPIVLSTPQKDSFLSELAARAIRGSRVRPFSLAPRALEWHQGGGSGSGSGSERTFLVLRVCSADDDDGDGDGDGANRDEDKNNNNRKNKSKKNGDTKKGIENPNPNPELSVLLARCNDLVTAYGQPALYTTNTTTDQSITDNKNKSKDSSADQSRIGDAFHVSLAWTFAAAAAAAAAAPPATSTITPALRSLTESVSAPFFGGVGPGARMRIRVDGVKAKIGNVVTHVELTAAAAAADRAGGGRQSRGGRRRRASGGGDYEDDYGDDGSGNGNGILGRV